MDLPEPPTVPPTVPPTEPATSTDLGLVDALAQLSFTLYGTLNRVATAHDLSVVQARLLGILRDRTPTIKELARFLGLDKSSVTGLVDRAEARGLVQRDRAPFDGRSVLVRMTAAGTDLLVQTAAAFEAEVTELVGSLTPVQRQRLAALARQVVVDDGRRRGVDILSGTPAPHPLAGAGVEPDRRARGTSGTTASPQ